MQNGYSCDAQEQTSRGNGEITKGATPFRVVKVKPNMMVWSRFVKSKDVDDQAAVKETVESLNAEQTWIPGVDCEIRQ